MGDSGDGTSTAVHSGAWAQTHVASKDSCTTWCFVAAVYAMFGALLCAPPPDPVPWVSWSASGLFGLVVGDRARTQACAYNRGNFNQQRICMEFGDASVKLQVGFIDLSNKHPPLHIFRNWCASAQLSKTMPIAPFSVRKGTAAQSK